jgi:hypothetical protein
VEIDQGLRAQDVGLRTYGAQDLGAGPLSPEP